jgi:flagellar M-ring protein FliF
VDGKDGKPRAEAEVARLGELAKRAVGFDAERGDTFDISSSPFVRAEEAAAPAPAAPSWVERPIVRTVLIGLGGLIALAIVAFSLRGKGSAVASRDLALLPGSRVAEIEAALARDAGLPPGAGRPALGDPAAAMRERAKELANKDPTRAAHILKAWMSQEQSTSTRNPPNG